MYNSIFDFTGLYGLSKTLRFELKPIGATAQNIELSGIISGDEHRAESYLKMKKIIDGYHKLFIEKSLDGLSLDGGTLMKYEEYYRKQNKSEEENKTFENIRLALRKQIVERFKEQDDWKFLFKKELITDLLKPFAEWDGCGLPGKTEDNIAIIDEFQSFTTYFVGFHQNRENMYSAEPISTAIAFRLIHDNLPKFISNIDIFLKIKTIPELREQIEGLSRVFGEYLNVESIDELFDLDYYSEVLTQKQIAVYNLIIGGKSDENSKIQGINEFINLYNQKQTDKANKLPKLKPLYKQILSDREVISWLPDAFSKDDEVLDAIRIAYQDFFINSNENICYSDLLKELLCNLDQFDMDYVFLANGISLTGISQHLSGNWKTIQSGLFKLVEKEFPRKKKENDEAYEERVMKVVKNIKNYSLSEINNALAVAGCECKVEDYFKNLLAINSAERQESNIFSKIKNAYTDAKDLLTGNYPEGKRLVQSEHDIEKLKTLLDLIKELQHFVKPLLGHDLQGEKDEKFYSDIQIFWDELDKFTPLYNKVRNYVTKKPYSTEKFKLNFDNFQLLGGWDVNKEMDYKSILLRRGKFYYLAIMDKKHNKSFLKQFDNPTEECYDKMEYKLLPGPNKMLPKVFFSKKGLELFKPSSEIQSIKNKESFKKGDNFSLSDCHKLIDFYKNAISLHPDWNKFGFSFSPTESYSDIAGFYREVEAQGYKISYRPIPMSYIDQLVEEGKIYLFQLYNKDFSEYSKGHQNLHTIYWNAVFDDRNLADIIYKLNGEAELFYRKKSLTPLKPTHPANQPIANKNPKNRKKHSAFKYDLIKDKRFTEDKFEFHVPITMNFKNQGSSNINDKVREFIKSSEDFHIIGIDRGERHLLYLAVIDLKGNIVEQFTLNDIVNEYNGETYETNYHDLLSKKEDERLKSRQSWKTIENIKELKEGYLSQVIHKISQLMIKYNAIVVLEDLNQGFMRGRQKVEKQVYQKFEKMLIDKLNYLVDKNAEASEPSGYLKALQLTNKVDTLSMIGKQCGFLFYIPAWNTSKIDPVSGFVNLFTSDELSYSSAAKASSFFGKFDSIRYNKVRDWFELKIDYDKFTSKAEGTQTTWTLCSNGTRIITFRNPEKNNQWDSKEINLTEEFKRLFEKFNIDINGNIKDAISEQGKDFYDGCSDTIGFCYLFKLTLQMRNSFTGTDVDYLISPIVDKDGKFFDSRNMEKTLPYNADANGAYNIARKGLMAVAQIKESAEPSKVKIDINNKSWLAFAQEKPYLNV